MRFKSEYEAYVWWEEAYLMSGHESAGRTREELFASWVEYQNVTWLDKELSDFIDEEFNNESEKS